MSFSYNNLKQYLKRNPQYATHFFVDLIKMCAYKCLGRKTVVITTGSGGIGDYLWIRNYLPVLKKQGYKTILIAMAHWHVIVSAFDKNNVDITRYLESCLSPKRIELLIFKLFKFDYYLNFNKNSIANFVRCKKEYNNTTIDNNLFYEERNNLVFLQFSQLPPYFEHSIPVIKPSSENEKKLRNPYMVLTEGGNTDGKLTDEQLITIFTYLFNTNYNIFYNGSIPRLNRLLANDHTERIIDGLTIPFPQYGYVIENASFVVTVNTSIYHFALQLDRPCVVISSLETSTIKTNYHKQIIVGNSYLQSQRSHIPDNEKRMIVQKTPPAEIVKAIDTMIQKIQ